jgi:hypothetical protein
MKMFSVCLCFSEQQARRLLVQKDMEVKKEKSGEILNNTGHHVFYFNVLCLYFSEQQSRRLLVEKDMEDKQKSDVFYFNVSCVSVFQ